MGIIGCNKEEVNTQQSQKYINTMEDAKLIPQIHNEVITWLLNEKDLPDLEVTKYAKNNFNFLDENFQDDMAYISYYVFEIKKYNRFSFEELLGFLSDSHVIQYYSMMNPSNSLFSTKEEFKKSLEDFSKFYGNKFSTKTISVLSNLFEKGIKGTSFDEIDSYLEDELTNVNNNDDLINLTLLKNQINASAFLWNSSESPISNNISLKAQTLDCEDWVIINDAIGGILGSVFNGAGSAILGGALSLGTRQDCK